MKFPLAFPLTSPMVEIIISPVGKQWVVCGVAQLNSCISEASITYKHTDRRKLFHRDLLYTLCITGALGFFPVSTI